MLKWFWLPVLTCAPLLAQAASFDCAKASAPVDQLICASPALSELDEKLAAAFKQSKAQTGTDGPALLAQQRQWLRGRQAACSVPQPLPNDKTALTACLSQQYQDRLQALTHPPQAVKGDDSLCQFVATGLREKAKEPGVNWSYPSAILSSGDQPMILKAKELESSKLSDFVATLKSRFHPSQTEAQKLSDWMYPEANATLSHIDGSDLYMLQVVEGSAATTYSLYFTASPSKSLQILDDPPFPAKEEGELDLGVTWAIAAISGQPAVIMGRNNGDIVGFDISALQDGKWGKACSISLPMETRLVPAEHHCVDGSCDRFVAAALGYAKSFAQSSQHQIGLSPNDLSHEQAEIWKRLLANTKADGTQIDMPIIGKAKWQQAYTGFREDSRRFPTLTDGQLMLVRIGKATLGWRDSDDVLVSFTAWQTGKAVPIAGVYVEKHRTAPTSITVQ